MKFIESWRDSTVGALTSVAVAILLSEFIILATVKGVIEPVLGEKVSPLFWDIFDPIALTIIVAPAIYYFLLRPMRQQKRLIEKQVSELAKANVEISQQTHEKANRAAELAIANVELAYQSDEKTKRAAELVIANIELAHETEEKAKRAEELTEVMERAESVREMAFYDVLTNLPNRRMLNDRLTQAMLAGKRSGYYSALLFLDLDNFKTLNDEYGHEVGDLLLIETANRLKRCVREIDTVARIGGDEFVVLLSELNIDEAGSKSHARIIAEKIHTSLSETYLLNLNNEGEADSTIEHRCTVSIGVVMFINHEVSQASILKHADSAMYKAKEAGRNQIRFFEQKV